MDRAPGRCGVALRGRRCRRPARALRAVRQRAPRGAGLGGASADECGRGRVRGGDPWANGLGRHRPHGCRHRRGPHGDPGGRRRRYLLDRPACGRVVHVRPAGRGLRAHLSRPRTRSVGWRPGHEIRHRRDELNPGILLINQSPRITLPDDAPTSRGLEQPPMYPVKRLMDAVGRFPKARVVVVGDLIADEYLYGKPARISREAPVLILRFTGRDVKLGGAANAAHNVHALGADATAVGVLGRDGAGDEIVALVRRAGSADGGLVRVPGRPTPVKTRIMAGSDQSTRHQVVRLDREPEIELPVDIEHEIIGKIRSLGSRADAFLVSDYGYGTVTPRIFETVLEFGRARGVP